MSKNYIKNWGCMRLPQIPFVHQKDNYTFEGKVVCPIYKTNPNLNLWLRYVAFIHKSLGLTLDTNILSTLKIYSLFMQNPKKYIIKESSIPLELTTRPNKSEDLSKH